MPFLQIGPHRIEYAVTVGTSRRYTYFRFRADRTLEIVVPRGRRVDLASTIRSRQDWIVKHFQEVSQSSRILDEDHVMFDGERLRLVFEESEEREELVHDPSRREVFIRSSDRSRVRELVRRWFLRETSRYVVGKLEELSRVLEVKYQRADVRQMKNWGYCTRDGRLSFNWQLIALPERLREYVIMHELAHLSEFNHSRAFKGRLAALCPDYRQRERELDRITSL
ncbi:MAG: YgjP-like metallopeptidase domain-containing protein [Nitrososphaerales archaeon]